jgi:hypothetical protein
MTSARPAQAGRVARRAAIVGCLVLLAACGSAALHAWTLDGTVRDAEAWVAAARAERVREALLDVAVQWLRPRACGDPTGGPNRLCKQEVRPILERELSTEWFESLLQRAHAALLAFVDDGRDRTLAEVGEARKRVRQELWALWRKAGGRDVPSDLPYLPSFGARDYQDRVASATAGVPDRVTLGWLAVARRTPAGLRNRIGDDVPSDAAARSPEGRALRGGWAWLQRARWGLPLAGLALGVLLVRLVRGLRWRLFAVGVALTLGGALHLAGLPVLRSAGRAGLDRALPPERASPAAAVPLAAEDHEAARLALIARGETQATASVIAALHAVGVRLLDATLEAGRLPALAALFAGGALLLAPVAAARPWRRRDRRRPADSLPPIIEPPPQAADGKGAYRMHGATGPLLLLVVVAGLAGCSTDRSRRHGAAGAACPPNGTLGLHERTQLVQNTLTVAGFGQNGPVSRARLAEHEAVELPVAVRPGYRYLLFAIGDGELEDVAAEVLDEGGAVLGRDAGYGPVAAIDYLAGAEATLRVRLRAEAGAGELSFLAWSRAGLESPGGFAGGGSGGGASCGLPIDLQPGGTVQGTTVGAFAGLTPTCATGDAPEHVYRLTLPARTVLRAEVEAEFDVVLSLLLACTDDPVATVRCSDTVGNSVIEEALPPGTYYLAVDGAGREAGTYRLTTQARQAPPPGHQCADLPLLVPGQTTTGTTVGRWNDFETEASCAGGSPGADAAWRLELDRPARVRLDLDADYDAALSLRRSCEDPGSIIACNDDTGGETRRSRIGRRLEPGSYTVVVDGVNEERGEYRLTALVVPDGELPPPGTLHDRCEDAAPLPAGEVLEAETLFAGDDGSGSCAVAPGGGDVVARLELDRPTVVDARLLEAVEPAPTLYLWRACGGPEAACGIGAVTAELPAGPAWLVVDAPPGGESDELYRVTWSGWDPAEAARLCDSAPELATGRPQAGRTEGQGFLKGSCGNAAEGAEAAYRLTLDQPGRVVLTLRADFDCVLFVRAACPGSGTELGCNDDDASAGTSRLELDLAAGTYWVFVDTYGAAEEGAYELQATVTP